MHRFAKIVSCCVLVVFVCAGWVSVADAKRGRPMLIRKHRVMKY